MTERMFEMELADRGVGFDPVAVSASGDTLGLDGMRERVEYWLRADAK